MHTLYISDLDGTLLNGNAELSDYTKSELNRLISCGANIGIATARTAATVVGMFDGVDMKIPCILMNGVCIYDLHNKHYIKVHDICDSAKDRLVNAINGHNLTGFMYLIKDDILTTYYTRLAYDYHKEFVAEREMRYGKKFNQIDNYTECINDNIVYYSVSDTKENLDGLYSSLWDNRDLHIEFYRDVYKDDWWYLEVFSCNASKYNAVKYLREAYDVSHIVGFGDNLNDIPLFEAADESYAVANAKDDVKARADGIIGTNTDDSVVKKIAEMCL